MLEQPIVLTEKNIKEIFFNYFSPLSLYIFGFTKDLDGTDDLVSELFVRFWSSRERLEFPNEVALRAYLFKCARNASLNALKSRNVNRISIVDSTFLEDISDDDDQGQQIRVQVIEAIYQEIQRLSPQYRRIVDLTLQGRSDDAIATELGIAKSSVWVNRMRAVRVLKKRLNDPTAALTLLFFLLVSKN